MDDAFFMRGSQAVRQLHRELYGFAGWQGAQCNALAQSFAFQQFGDDEVHAIGIADVVYRDDVGMIQSGDRASFCSKRRRRSGSLVNDGGRTFRATSRRSRVSRAR